VHRVAVSNPSDRVVYIIRVPQGNTVYQASDGRYYGRSEFGNNYLRDNDVRLRMNRGKVARASMYVCFRGVQLGIEEEKTLRVIHAGAPDAYKNDPGNVKALLARLSAYSATMSRVADKTPFEIILKNDGEPYDPHADVRVFRAPLISYCEFLCKDSSGESVRLEKRQFIQATIVREREQNLVRKGT
jgi:hypothetical protein